MKSFWTCCIRNKMSKLFLAVYSLFCYKTQASFHSIPIPIQITSPPWMHTHSSFSLAVMVVPNTIPCLWLQSVINHISRNRIRLSMRLPPAIIIGQNNKLHSRHHFSLVGLVHTSNRAMRWQRACNPNIYFWRETNGWKIEAIICGYKRVYAHPF